MKKVTIVFIGLLIVKTIYNLAISQEFRITNDIYFDKWPEVDPFTKEIYYFVDNPWDRGVYKVSVNGGSGELTPFYNIPAFFKNEHKAIYISETDSLSLYDFNTNSNINLVYIDSLNIHNPWVSISPDQTRLFPYHKLPSYYSLLDSSYHVLPYSPFVYDYYPFCRIQWRGEDNLIFIKYDPTYNTIILNFNYNTMQLDTVFYLNIAYSTIEGIAYNQVYNLLAYSYDTPQFSSYVSLLDLNTMQDTLIFYPDTNQTVEWVGIDEMVWNESGRKLGIIGNHPTIPAGELYLYDLFENNLDTLTDYPANNLGTKMGLRWFGEDTLIYSKYVYQTEQWQIFGFSTNKISNIYQLPQVKISSFICHQNYPNPFNSLTIISFKLPEANKVDLKIVNNLGQQVKNLVSAKLLPGRYEFKWDGMDEYHQQVSSGIYYYRLQVGKHSQTRKMLLLR